MNSDVSSIKIRVWFLFVGLSLHIGFMQVVLYVGLISSPYPITLSITSSLSSLGAGVCPQYVTVCELVCVYGY